MLVVWLFMISRNVTLSAIIYQYFHGQCNAGIDLLKHKNTREGKDAFFTISLNIKFRTDIYLTALNLVRLSNMRKIRKSARSPFTIQYSLFSRTFHWLYELVWIEEKTNISEALTNYEATSNSPYIKVNVYTFFYLLLLHLYCSLFSQCLEINISMAFCTCKSSLSSLWKEKRVITESNTTKHITLLS